MITTSTRRRVLGRIADHLVERRPGHPPRVAVDGITAAGKTTLARELTEAVIARGRPAAHLSMDGFHHPRAHRHRQGRDSVDEPPVSAAEDMVLVVDGSFLQRELTWDEVVFVDTAFDQARARGTRRDAELFGGVEQAEHAFDQRYHAASRRYVLEVDPARERHDRGRQRRPGQPGPAAHRRSRAEILTRAFAAPVQDVRPWWRSAS